MRESDHIEGLLIDWPPTESELLPLLTAHGELQQELFRRAREVRRANHADAVVLRGVIEISNYCQKRCGYCAMRCVNKALQRYRMKPDDILAIAAEIKRANITTVFLQSGQDPRCDPILEQVIPELKQGLHLNVLLCLGERPREVYARFAELGADSYILKFETSDAGLY